MQDGSKGSREISAMGCASSVVAEHPGVAVAASNKGAVPNEQGVAGSTQQLPAVAAPPAPPTGSDKHNDSQSSLLGRTLTIIPIPEDELSRANTHELAAQGGETTAAGHDEYAKAKAALKIQSVQRARSSKEEVARLKESGHLPAQRASRYSRRCSGSNSQRRRSAHK